LLVRFSNNIPLAVAGYNAGAFAVQRAGGIPEHSRGYVDHVMGLYRALPRVAAWLDLEAVDAADACNPSDADPGSC
jgi:soluble lytic murein transglycosylase-like protein